MNADTIAVIVAEGIAIAILSALYLNARREGAELRLTLAARREDADNVRARIVADDVARVASTIARLAPVIEANGQTIAALAGVHDRIAHALERIGQSEVWGGIPIDVDLTRTEGKR